MGHHKLIDLNVMVLTTGSWPLETPVNTLALPDELQRCIERFTAFYASQSTGRRLHWALDLSNGDVATHCFRRKYTFQANTFHIVILLLFNETDILPIKNIAEISCTTLPETHRYVESLVQVRTCPFLSFGADMV